MKNKKIIFDMIFIVISGVILISLNHFGFLEKYSGFALLPILIAYYIGQYTGRKYKKT